MTTREKKIHIYAGHGYSSIIPPPVPAIGTGDVSSEDFFLPSVIVWNPYLIYPHIIPSGSIKCIHCGMPLNLGYWNDGSTTDKQPRVLHGINNIVLLVSAVYVCDNRHKLLAHDEIILGKFPASTMVPFLLLHRTGFTRELVDMCTAICRRGINFYNLESMIIERRWETFARQQQLIQIHGKISQQPISLSDFWESSLSNSPSNDALSKCFLAEFLEHEQLYLNEMTCIPTRESISFDHTFKVATNIGYIREDGRWISEYDGLFIVLNENGQVLTWQLTKGTSFAHITTLLQDLLERPNQQIKTVYVDECCKVRAKIKSVFGPNIIVKLDLFHAIQRITKTFSKKQTLTQECMLELRRVFRCDGDSGEKRLSNTPPPNVILLKLQKFVEKWKDRVDDKGVKLFKTDTFTALKNLKVHISTGCLSDIPPGGGTNRNERLHQHVNSFFNRSRIGILLAYALLTMIFYSHNNSIRLRGKCIIRPAVASTLQATTATTSKAIGIMPKERMEHHQQADHWEKDNSTNIEDFCSIVPIYCTSLHKLQIKRILQKMKLSEMTRCIKYFQPVTSTMKDNDEIDTEMDTRLSEYGLVHTPVAKDGNCFFHSVALNITSNLDSWLTCLTRIGIDSTLDSKILSMKLRQAFVREILGERHELYKSFLIRDLDYRIEANKFLQDGFYASSVGDLMPLAMATILQTSILIIPTTSNNHPFYVTPQAGCMEGTIILVYNPTGPGHYDAALPYSSTVGQSTVSTLTTTARCRCGVNKKNSGSICSPSAVYSSRCKCYLNSQPCGSQCSCKGCANPHGARIPSPKKQKRKRRLHSLQTDIPTSKRFAVERGESLSNGSWSDFESIVLEEIMMHHQDAAAIDITNTYNKIVYYSKSTFCNTPLQKDVVFRQKTTTQVNNKMQYVKKHSA